ncbi:helix-turn-helix domain-containing protein [Dyadobacter psychrotolerans]|uniref:Helix-turn-helix domain-containing protein n=1 Tax=Dyadobacter psychrotolerans TaxID=2541721 RepID=A0A4R5DC08_9BACT|nr:helix-turn-helix domain-containing protein [Dyadobacter psychrotolerans]TDE08075.1 helix-turn-helix domain-containing protein [Dyadobacter psychrotolerans]
MKIGSLLRKLRDQKGMSARLVAERVGVSHSTYVDWELDKSSPSIRSYVKLATAFDFNPVELMAYLTGQGNQPSDHQDSIVIRDNKEIIAQIRNYSILVQENNDRVEKALIKMQELIDGRFPSISDFEKET